MLQLIYLVNAFSQSARVCKASVIIRDLYTQEEIDAKLSISGFNITISEEQLTPYRNYYLVITASNPHGTGVSSEQFSKSQATACVLW